MDRLIRHVALLGVILLIPIVPFLLAGEWVDAQVAAWCADPPSPAAVAAVVVGLLAGDVLLPVPSSLVGTLAGSQLGVVGGTAASWTGMTLGAVVAFGLGRWFGPLVARRLATADDLQRSAELTSRFGPWVLVVCRAVPVLAEASVLVLGVHRLPWRRFWLPMLLSNLGIALAYAAFGTVAARHHWLPAALAISVALPLSLSALARRWLGKRGRS